MTGGCGAKDLDLVKIDERLGVSALAEFAHNRAQEGAEFHFRDSAGEVSKVRIRRARKTRAHTLRWEWSLVLRE